MPDFASITTITFDCYGTLIDWEAGILNWWRSVAAVGSECGGETGDILAAYAVAERRAEAQAYMPYREVLGLVSRDLARENLPSDIRIDHDALAAGLPSWPAFPDTAAALRRIRSRYGVGVISNIDDDLFGQTRCTADLDIDWVVTAQQCRSYKPSLNNFRTAMLAHTLVSTQVLHVASSIAHDIAPANQLGIATVHLHRRAGQQGAGANGPGEARPKFTVPDMAGLLALLNIPNR